LQFAAVAIGCGLRLGEILALHWEDMNFENSTLSVKRTLQKVNNKGRFGEPKSKKARRSVAMPRFVLDALKDGKETGLIFATRNGTPFSHRNIHRHFKKTLVKLGLPEIRFHDLKHSYASILASQNVHPKTVQEALGHSTITLTLDTYSHILRSLQKEAAEKLDLLLLTQESSEIMERMDEETSKHDPILNDLDVFFAFFARPRSSMDRVTDFESGGCAFEPRRGRLHPYAIP